MRLPDALPPLTGRAGAALRACYLALLALTVAMLSIGGWMSARDFFVTVPNNLEFGFMTGSGSVRFPDPNRVRIYTVTSEAARRSGLRPDDIIVSINGRPFPERGTELELGDMMGEVEGDTLKLVTRSSDGRVRTHDLPRQPDAWSASIAKTGLTGWQRSAILFGADQLRLFVLLLAAILLYWRRPRDPVALLFGAAFLIYCEGSGSAFWFWHGLGMAKAKDWIGPFAYPFLIVGLNAFPDGKLGSIWRRLTVFLGIPLFFAIVAARLLGMPLPTAVEGYVLIGLLLISAAGLAFRYRRLPPGPERQQIKWAVMGFVAFALVMSLVWIPGLVGFRLLSGDSPASFITLVLLSTATGIVLPLGLLVSLLRYRLYDADAAISRSATYSFLTLLLLIAFSIARNGIDLVAGRYFDGTPIGAASSGLAVALAALLITPLHKRVMRWSENRFQPGLRRLRRVPQLVDDLRETAPLARLADRALDQVATAVRSTRAALLVDGQPIAERGGDVPSGVLESAQASGPFILVRGDPLYPVRLSLTDADDESVGTLLLGPRPDGSLYGKAEREALIAVAAPIGRAISVVRHRESAAEEQAGALRELRSDIEALKASIAGLTKPGRRKT